MTEKKRSTFGEPRGRAGGLKCWRRRVFSCVRRLNCFRRGAICHTPSRDAVTYVTSFRDHFIPSKFLPLRCDHREKTLRAEFRSMTFFIFQAHTIPLHTNTLQPYSDQNRKKTFRELPRRTRTSSYSAVYYKLRLMGEHPRLINPFCVAEEND